MKIYFCGSISAGREDAPIYHQMVTLLKKYGTVLTEHVGDPTLSEDTGAGIEGFIWKRDTDWLAEADIVIAECSRPSHGVGYELGFAEAHGKKVHIFYGREDGKLSKMLDGNPHFNIHIYKNTEDLLSALKAVMEQ